MTWIEITNAEYIDGYKMSLLFNDGQKRVFDFLPLIEQYPVFKPLHGLTLFKAFTITDTLEWDNGNIDIAPEYIYENGMKA